MGRKCTTKIADKTKIKYTKKMTYKRKWMMHIVYDTYEIFWHVSINNEKIFHISCHIQLNYTYDFLYILENFTFMKLKRKVNTRLLFQKLKAIIINLDSLYVNRNYYNTTTDFRVHYIFDTALWLYTNKSVKNANEHTCLLF